MQEGIPAANRATATGVPVYLKVGAEVVGTVEMTAKMVQPEGMDVTMEMPPIDTPLIEFGAYSTMPQSKARSDDQPSGLCDPRTRILLFECRDITVL
jgi:hypothetical protein